MAWLGLGRLYRFRVERERFCLGLSLRLGWNEMRRGWIGFGLVLVGAGTVDECGTV